MESDWSARGFQIDGPEAWVEHAEEALARGEYDDAALLVQDAVRAGWAPDEGSLTGELLDCSVAAVAAAGSPTQWEQMAAAIHAWLLENPGDVSGDVIAWLESAAGMGIVDAPAALGLVFSERKDPESHTLAIHWFDAALKSGNLAVGPAAVEYLTSSFTELDDRNLAQRLQEWGALGCAEASRAASWLMIAEYEGEQVRGNSMMWMYRAARQGSAGAPCDLALLLLAESPPHTEEAQWWLSRCDRRGERTRMRQTLQGACDGDADASHALLELLEDHDLLSSPGAAKRPVAEYWLKQAARSTDGNVLSHVIDIALANTELVIAARGRRTVHATRARQPRR